MRAMSGDVELDYELMGDGPPLVWLHGLSGSLDESRPLCERLAKRFTVLWYSSRGHGRSSPVHEKDRYRYDHIVDDLERMLDQRRTPASPTRSSRAGRTARTPRCGTRSAIPGAARRCCWSPPGANALRRPDRFAGRLVRGQMRWRARRGEPHVVKAITGHDPRDPAPGRDRARTPSRPRARTTSPRCCRRCG